ncbi:MAG: alanyl-tRNA editing protein [Clostridia bacterium]|nr:alanyl-tRNA editing protein [Clostridia bacterium]
MDGIAATDRLYYENAYLRAFDARVIAVREDGWAALDRSAFYPTSGGQPFDTGTLNAARVLNVEVENGVVWHKTDATLCVGEEVHGEIDWPQRWDHMQQHAGDHMLAGAAWQLFGGVTIGLHLGKENSTIDMDLPGGRTHLTAEETEALETLVNKRVQQDDPIRCWFPGAEELAALPLRKRPTVDSHVRVVAMGDYEMVPCGGTHPSSTGQIGPVKILSCTPARGKMRLCFVAGMRAVAYFQQTAACAEQVAAALSSTVAEAPEAFQREREAHLNQQKENAQCLTQAALEILRLRKSGRVYAAHLPFADRDVLLSAAKELTKDPRAVALLSCPGKSGHALLFARGAEADCDMAALLQKCGGKGGGKPDLAQGSASDETALEQAAAFLESGN